MEAGRQDSLLSGCDRLLGLSTFVEDSDVQLSCGIQGTERLSLSSHLVPFNDDQSVRKLIAGSIQIFWGIFLSLEPPSSSLIPGIVKCLSLASVNLSPCRRTSRPSCPP